MLGLAGQRVGGIPSDRCRRRDSCWLGMQTPPHFVLVEQTLGYLLLPAMKRCHRGGLFQHGAEVGWVLVWPRGAQLTGRECYRGCWDCSLATQRAAFLTSHLYEQDLDSHEGVPWEHC